MANVAKPLTVPYTSSVREFKLTRWNCPNGWPVAVNDPLCELETEKATVDLPSPHAGILRQRASVGQVVHSGDEIGQIEPF